MQNIPEKTWNIFASHVISPHLTHWGRVMHICIGNLTIIGSDNGLAHSRRQAYLNQCWNILNWTLRNKLQWNFKQNLYIFIQENAFDCVVCEMAAILSRPQCVKCHRLLKFTQGRQEYWTQLISLLLMAWGCLEPGHQLWYWFSLLGKCWFQWAAEDWLPFLPMRDWAWH